MYETIKLNKDIPVKKYVDVLVVGGGAAGVCAALGAAIDGSKVLLIERETCLGGLGTLGFIPAFMPFGDHDNFLAGGIGKLLYKKMQDNNIIRPDNIFNHEKLKVLYENILLEHHVEILYLTTVIESIVENHLIKSVIVSSKTGLYAIKAKTFIDCTGDGDLSYISGAKFLMGDEQGKMMGGTLCSIFSDVDFKNFDVTDQEKYIDKAYDEGILSVRDKHLPGMFYHTDNIAFGNLGHAYGLDGTSEESLTKSLIEQRKAMIEYEAYYNKYIKGFENAKLLLTAPMMGVRESRRILCDYVLTSDDFINRRSFEDEIGRYNYAIDLHEAEPTKEANEKFKKEYYEKYRYKKGESYGIPYRSLTVLGFDNLLVAGRCISCDRLMLGSIRVMPGCFITGQAAGIAASMSSQNNQNIRDIDIQVLKKKIKQMLNLC